MNILKQYRHKFFVFILSLLVMTSFSVAAAEMKSMSGMNMQKTSTVESDRDPFEHADGYEYRGMAGWEETDEMSISKFIVDQLEYRQGDQEDLQRWDMQAWQGTDYERIWLKFEGDRSVTSGEHEIELQTLYSQAIAAFWDLQYGVRIDQISDADNRYFAVLGMQGLAPYWFEMEPAIFIDNNGNVSARLVASYDLLLTQRLIFQPRVEANLSANTVSEYGIGQGLNDLQFDMRLRYEFSREFAPYVGVAWQKKYGETADFVSPNAIQDTQLVMGVRLWF